MIFRTTLTVLVLAAFALLQAAPALPQSKSTASKTANFAQISREADRARQEDRSDDAIRWYRRGLDLQPSWQEGLWYLSTLLYEKEQYSEARDVLRRFVSYDPGPGPGWALLGMSEFQTRDYARALDHLRRAKAVGLGGRAEMAKSVSYFLAVLFTRFEQYDESMGLLSETVNSGMCDDATVEAAGLAAVRMPLLPSEIPPDRRKMIRLAGSGFCALQLGQRDDAEKLFSQMVTAYPNEPGAHFLFGTFLMTARPEDGIRELRRELEISPFHVPARLRLAEGYLRDEKIDQALPLAGEAVKIDPGDASAHMLYGEALAAKKDLSGAIRELEMARGQAPQMVRVHWDLVRTYTAAGRAADANREKEEIEKLNHAGGGE